MLNKTLKILYLTFQNNGVIGTALHCSVLPYLFRVHDRNNVSWMKWSVCVTLTARDVKTCGFITSSHCAEDTLSTTVSSYLTWWAGAAAISDPHQERQHSRVGSSPSLELCSAAPQVLQPTGGST